jgi:hypothetical protein
MYFCGKMKMKLNNPANFKWIDTTGGPFIILRAEDVKKWSGSFSIQSVAKQEIIIEEDFLNPAKTDYGKACQVLNEIDIIDFASNSVIVIGLEYLITLKKVNERIFLIFQWEYGSSMEAVENFLQSVTIDEIQYWQATGLYTKLSGEYIIFDSSEIGFDLKKEELLKFEPDTGIYQIETADYKPDQSTFLRIFKFEKQ